MAMTDPRIEVNSTWTKGLELRGEPRQVTLTDEQSILKQLGRRLDIFGLPSAMLRQHDRLNEKRST